MRWLQISLLAYTLSLVACAHPTIVATPGSGITPQQAQTAYTADQIVLRVNELQAAAIAAESSSGIPTGIARIIVTFTVEANKTLKLLPSGWQATLQDLWLRAKGQIGPVTNPTVSAAMLTVEVALATLGGQ